MHFVTGSLLRGMLVHMLLLFHQACKQCVCACACAGGWRVSVESMCECWGGWVCAPFRSSPLCFAQTHAGRSASRTQWGCKEGKAVAVGLIALQMLARESYT